MTCECGYYSTCSEGCTPDRIRRVKAQMETDFTYYLQLISEYQKDADEAREERHS